MTEASSHQVITIICSQETSRLIPSDGTMVSEESRNLRSVKLS